MKVSRPTNKILWSEHDLIDRLSHALDIAGLAVEHLAAEGFSDAANPGKSIRPEKVIAETAILLTAASFASADLAITQRATKVAEQLIPYARSKRVVLGLCLEPSAAWDHALAHVCLTRLGHRDAGFDELLRKSLEAQAHPGRERVPHRVLEQEWAARAWIQNARARSRAGNSAARQSVLNRPVDLLNGSRDDCYAFTHALMYVADFGTAPATLPRARRRILAEAEGMLARCLDEQDYDLAGEVLLSWPLTGKGRIGELWSPSAAFGFRVLAKIEDQAAFLPTPATRISELQVRTGVDRTRYLLATAYHTAYVMGLLCAASLHPGCAPPVRLRPTRGKPGAAGFLAKFLADPGPAPHWWEEYQKLDTEESDALAPLLVNVALRRKASARDLEGMRNVLEAACELNLDDTPAAIQAMEMLDRFSSYASLIAHSQSGDTPGGFWPADPLLPSARLKSFALAMAACRGRTSDAVTFAHGISGV